jgi:hypothetical protein
MSDGGQIPPIADEKGRSTLIRVERPKGWVMGGGKLSPSRTKCVDGCASALDNAIPSRSTHR